MNIYATKYENLTKEYVSAWSDIQRAEPSLDSPYFRPEFTQAVASVRNDVEVAVLEEGDQPLAFLPFQRSRRKTGRPVGGNLSDFHGLIGSPNVTCDPIQLLRACQLTSWHFDHLLSEQRQFSAFVFREADSPFVDLTDGMDVYLARRRNGRSLMSEYGQKLRKLTREVGPLRFEAHVGDREILETLFAWKSEHIRRLKTPNALDYSWVRKLIETILECQSPDFSGVLSVVYAGDQVAAIDFGMRSRAVLHSWFPTYNVELSRYSPGLLCWIETMKVAESLGIRRLDFGKGTEGFKHRLKSGASRVAEGAADSRPGPAMIRRACWMARDLIRTSPLAKPASSMSQRVRRARHWLALHAANHGRYS